MKNDYSQNPSTCIRENDKYLKITADTSAIACDEILSVMDLYQQEWQMLQQKFVPARMASTIAINVSINFDGKTVRYKMSIFCTQFYQHSYYY